MAASDNSRIKVLELCLSPHQGGLELYVADISQRLSSVMDVCCVVGKDSKIAPLMQPLAVITLPKLSHYMPLFAAKKLASLMDEREIDVVHMHWNHDLTLAVLAKLFSHRKLKLILTRHMKFPSRKNSFFHRFLYRNIDHIMAITQTMAFDLKRFIPDDVRPNISVNYLGIEPLPDVDRALIQQRRKGYDPEGNQFLIALVGRIAFEKGHEFLLEALKIAKGQGLPFKALVVGHPMQESYLTSLKQKVNDAGLQEHMIFTGFVDEPRCVMQACDVLVLPTIEETFGLVLIEAMSVGLPVIGSNRGGVPEIINHEETGLLFESCDSQSLFDALYQIYSKPDVAKQYAAKAKASAHTQFHMDRHMQQLVACLEEVGHG